MRRGLRSITVATTALLILTGLQWTSRAEISDGSAWSIGGILGVTIDAVEDAGSGLAEGSAKVVGKALMLGNIAAKVLIQMGYEMKVDVKYEPEDAPGAIHLKHDHNAPPSSKSIMFEGKVEYKKDWEKSLPAPTARKILGMNLPQQGPGKDILVSWYIPDKLYKWTTVLAGDFNAGTNPTWTSRTGEDGIAKGMIHPIWEENILGGIKKVEEMKVRAEARVQAAQGLAKDNVDVGASAADFLLATVQGTGTVMIERHVPTEWEGSMEVVRQVTGTWKQHKNNPLTAKGELGVFNEDFYGNERWSGTVIMPNMHFTTAGLGTGDYNYQIEGEQETHAINRGRIMCDDGPISVTENLDVQGTGSGEENGKADAEIRIRTGDDGKPQYTISFIPTLIGSRSLMAPYFRSDGKIAHKWQDCDGNHNIVNPHEIQSKFGLNQWLLMKGYNTAPYREWKPFDRDAMTLTGSATWERKTDLGSDAPNVWVSTTIEWNLKRIIPEAMRTPAK